MRLVRFSLITVLSNKNHEQENGNEMMEASA